MWQIGLAVTGMGGDVLYIEVSATGSGTEDGEVFTSATDRTVGDVMKESAQIALVVCPFARKRIPGVDPAALNRTVHVHVPAGAVPKDGCRRVSPWSPH